ncbi:MAG: MarP family serine protease [Actinomycetota bacterium]|nr:MarP family serine protease [Actinomycetota bacterium]
MNFLDVLIVVMIASAAIGGYRLGFVTRVVSWLGLVLGVVGGALLLPRVVRSMESTAGRQQLLLVAAAVIIGCAFLGQALGLFLGARLHLALPEGSIRKVDSGIGGIAGVAGVLVAVWLLAPAMADVPDWPAQQARTSRVVRAIDGVFPAPPDATRTLRRLVGQRFPQVFGALDPAPQLGPPPAASGLDAATAERVARSTVEIVGGACDRIQEGTGFVVGDGLVATNAHVVAGEDSTRLERVGGSPVNATVVAFDPARDLALLRAPGLDRPVLAIGDTTVGGRGAVFGHPGGGPLRLAPFQVGRRGPATGSDIYDRGAVQRDILVLSAALRPGDSGSALVDRGGHVVGVAFAIAPDKPNVAYALSITELRSILAAPRAGRVSTGPCIS